MRIAGTDGEIPRTRHTSVLNTSKWPRPEQAELLWKHWDRLRISLVPGHHLLHVSQPDYLRRMTRFMRDFMFE